MKRSSPVSMLLLFAAIMFASCKKVDTAAITLGKITGTIVSANNKTTIKVASVFTTVDGQLYFTQTDATGSFTLEAPAGSRRITIQTGDGSMFRTEVDVVVKEDMVTAISAVPVKLNLVANLAFIPGVYDKIENIVQDSLGYTMHPLIWDNVRDMSQLTAYDAIFLNCTTQLAMQNFDSLTYANLATYVANGGSLYISDWAVKALVGQSLGPTTSCSIPRVGGFIPDSLLCVRQGGAQGSLLNNPITSSSLQSYLNKTSIDKITYNLLQWEKVQTLNTNFWETMVTSSAGEPLLIRTNLYTDPSKGTFTIGSTTANAGYSLVCVSGTGGQHFTLSVRTSEVAGLVASGATNGACNNSNGSGRIYFTTFHNEPNAHIASDVKNILDYVILNL